MASTLAPTDAVNNVSAKEHSLFCTITTVGRTIMDKAPVIAAVTKNNTKGTHKGDTQTPPMVFVAKEAEWKEGKTYPSAMGLNMKISAPRKGKNLISSTILL